MKGAGAMEGAAAADCAAVGMLTGCTSGGARVVSTYPPVEVALSCSARFKASWMRLIVSFPWGNLVRIDAGGQPASLEFVKLPPDRTFPGQWPEERPESSQ